MLPNLVEDSAHLIEDEGFHPDQAVEDLLNTFPQHAPNRGVAVQKASPRRRREDPREVAGVVDAPQRRVRPAKPGLHQVQRVVEGQEQIVQAVRRRLR